MNTIKTKNENKKLTINKINKYTINISFPKTKKAQFQIVIVAKTRKIMKQQ